MLSIVFNQGTLNNMTYCSQVGEIGCILTLLYTLLILPTMLLYRSLEIPHEVESSQEQQMTGLRDRWKYPPQYEEGVDQKSFPSFDYSLYSI